MKKLMAFFLALGILFSATACGQSGSSAPAQGTSGTSMSTDASSAADSYPGSELRIIVPFMTGGALDVQARLIAKYLGEELDTNVIVENIKGAAGTLGTTQYLAEKPNSNVILLMDAWLTSVYPMINQVEFTAEDFVPIIDHNCVDFMLFTQPDSGIKNLDDLKAFAEKNGRILFASDGVGGTTYIVQKSLYDQLGIACDTISVNGAVEGVTNLMAGSVNVAMSSMNMVGDYVSNGDIQPIVCFSSEDIQDEVAGTIPCAKSCGINETYQGYYYYVARSGTDQTIIDKLYDAFSAVYANPDFIAEQGVLDFKAPGRNGTEIQEHMVEFTEMAKSTFSLG